MEGNNLKKFRQNNNGNESPLENIKFTKIPNVFLEQMDKHSGAAVKVFMAICRKTIGWGKSKDRISYSQLEEMTGITRRWLKEPLRELLRAGWISRSGNPKSAYTFCLVTDKILAEQKSVEESSIDLWKKVPQIQKNCGTNFPYKRKNLNKYKDNISAEALSDDDSSRSSIKPKNDYEKIERHFTNAYREVTGGKEPAFNYGAVRKLERERLKSHTAEEINELITAAKEDEWIRENGAFDLTAILSARMFNKLQQKIQGSPEKESERRCPICDVGILGARSTCPVCYLPVKDFRNPEAVEKYKEQLKNEATTNENFRKSHPADREMAEFEKQGYVEVEDDVPFQREARKKDKTNLCPKSSLENFVAEWKKKLKKQNHGEITYPEEFERWWKKYPRRAGKKMAFKCWLDCLEAGATLEILLTAASNYKAACQKEGTTERYIKHPSTFLGPDEPWRDHIAARGSPGSKKSSNTCPICDIELIGVRLTCPGCELPFNDFTNPEAVEKYRKQLKDDERRRG